MSIIESFEVTRAKDRIDNEELIVSMCIMESVPFMHPPNVDVALPTREQALIDRLLPHTPNETALSDIPIEHATPRMLRHDPKAAATTIDSPLFPIVETRPLPWMLTADPSFTICLVDSVLPLCK